MILNHNNLTIEKNNIQIKKPLQYSDQFIFYPIKYQKKDFIIQTPKLFLIEGIKHYSTINSNKYIDLSFQNKHLDKSIVQYQRNLLYFYETIKSFFITKYSVEPFMKSNIKFDWMRYKISENCLFFDEQKNKIHNLKDIKKTYGTFIIHLHGLWCMNQTIWFDWKIIQAQINVPCVLNKFMINIPNSKIPPPPPPPPPPPIDKYQKMLKLGVSKEAIEQKRTIDRIQASDLQNIKLKKTNINHIKNKKKKNDSFTPSLDEIRNALQCLHKIN
jgi:hypothetical protein